MKLHNVSQVTILFQGVFLLCQPITLARTPIEQTIDRSLRTNSIPGASQESNQLIVSLKQWIGPYKNLRKQGNSYIANFERGSLPLQVSLNGVGAGCPRTSVPLSKAPSNLRTAFAQCPNLKP
jgi:hypothetical protein